MNITNRSDAFDNVEKVIRYFYREEFPDYRIVSNLLIYRATWGIIYELNNFVKLNEFDKVRDLVLKFITRCQQDNKLLFLKDITDPVS